MTPGAERAPAATWHRLLALSQRWYVRLGLCALGFLAIARLIPSGLLLTLADTIFIAGWIVVLVGQAIFAVPQINEAIESWPDTRWARWAKPVFQVAGWAAIGAVTLASLYLPFVLIYPALMNMPLNTVVIVLFLIGVVPIVLIGTLAILLGVGALVIVLPIGIVRATARARRRRRYDYPPHLPRR